MEDSKQIPTINGINVKGEAHLQPGENPWIGVFAVPVDLLEGKPEEWQFKKIHYQGPFDCQFERIFGRSDAIIKHVRCVIKGGELLINVEGTCKANLEKRPKKKITTGYSSNLPVDSILRKNDEK